MWARKPVRFLQYSRDWPASCLLLQTVFVFFLCTSQLFARTVNGFDLDGSLVPAADIHHGGPPRDGIPAIDRPQFIAANEAVFLTSVDRVLGIQRNGKSRAYPIRILNYHEIVNDHFGTEAVVITYCPLCGTGMAFSATIDGRDRQFGVSGLLYNSDVLLYDRETESLWSQIRKQAITGPERGKHLKQLVLEHTSWIDWQTRHPATRVLSPETGYSRDYSRSPYAGYETSSSLYFPAGRIDPRYHAKEQLIGVQIGDTFKAYPFAELSRTTNSIDDEVAGRKLTIEFDAANRTGRVFTRAGRQLPVTLSYWFAWTAFHPETQVYRAP